MTVLIVALVLLVVITTAATFRVIRQYERGVVFRFGRLLSGPRGPGLTALVPGVDRLQKVNLQIVTMPVPGQDGVTRDNITVRVDAVVYFNVSDPVRAVVNVEDYLSAMGQLAQTSLRSIIGKSDLDDLLSNRERLNEGLELMIDSPALEWGVHIHRVEIKDVSLPETMRRSIARQAEAERERRSRIISADGEYQASQKLSQAAQVMSENPSALQLRLLETVVEVAAEKNSTLVLPFPVELLRFVDSAGQAGAPGSGTERTEGAETGEAETGEADTGGPATENAATPENTGRSERHALTGNGPAPPPTTPQPRSSAELHEDRDLLDPQGIA